MTIEEDLDKISRVVLPYDELRLDHKFQLFSSLLYYQGEFLHGENEYSFKKISSDKIVNNDQRIGISLLANTCFERDMGLPSIKVVGKEASTLLFATKHEVPIGFFFTDAYDDPYGRKVIYVDIVGVINTERSRGLLTKLGQLSINYQKSRCDKDIVIVTRTQNPLVVSSLVNILSKTTPLSPFFTPPNKEIRETLNWLVNSDKISRNDRKDSHFDAFDSLIHWGAYGHTGDGSTWENMIKGYDIDWDMEIPLKMLQYLNTHGSNLNEALTKGHAFIVAALIKNHD